VAERAAEPFTDGSRRWLRVEDERAGGEPILRPSLLPSLLAVRRRNADAGLAMLDLFEFGSAFHIEGESHRERAVLGVLLDARAPEARGVQGDDGAATGLRRLRGVLERLARLLCGPGASTTLEPLFPGAPPAALGLSPAATVRWNDEVVGVAGVLSAAVRSRFGLDAAIVGAEIEVAPFLDAFPPEVTAEAMPAFPAIDRDLSILVDERVTWSDIDRTVRSAAPPRLETVDFVGTYRGRQTGGRKSVTLRLLFRDPSRTMRREEADDAVAAVLSTLSATLGAELRA